MRCHLVPLRLIPFLVVCCLSAVTGYADLPRPRPRPAPTPPAPANSNELQVRLSIDDNVKEAHLRIPASALKANAQPGQPRSDSGISPVRTVVAGVSLTAAIAITGLLLVRGRGGRGRMLMLVGLVAGAGILATMAMADVPPPRRPVVPPPGVVVIPAGGLKMPVVIEIVDDGPIQLTIPAGTPAPKPSN